MGLMTKVITDAEYLKTIKEKEGKQVKKGSKRGRGRPQILQESMNELISEEDFNFLEDGGYNDEIRTVYYDLLSKNVSIENCKHVVRTVLETFTKRKKLVGCLKSLLMYVGWWKQSVCPKCRLVKQC